MVWQNMTDMTGCKLQRIFLNKKIILWMVHTYDNYNFQLWSHPDQWLISVNAIDNFIFLKDSLGAYRHLSTVDAIIIVASEIAQPLVIHFFVDIITLEAQ